VPKLTPYTRPGNWFNLVVALPTESWQFRMAGTGAS
jgi:hypothetical protein